MLSFKCKYLYSYVHTFFQNNLFECDEFSCYVFTHNFRNSSVHCNLFFPVQSTSCCELRDFIVVREKKRRRQKMPNATCAGWTRIK